MNTSPHRESAEIGNLITRGPKPDVDSLAKIMTFSTHQGINDPKQFAIGRVG